jgi:lipopolysaccharide/colanic/teichoic acid biosynthesis glycosyltransferase
MESTVTTTDSNLAGTGNKNLSHGGVGTRPSIRTAFEGMNEATMQADLTDETTRSKTGIPTWKRCFDLSLILLSAPLWLPVCLLIALVIRLGSRGPILFQQERVGQGGRVFTCYKFRTMHLNAPQSTHREHVKDLIESSSPMI